MAFTEFVCRSGGSNLNGGGLNGGTEPATAAVYTCTNSNWDGVSVFTPTDGSTPASTVTVGDFASVYLDAATVAVYVARVTVVAAGVNGAITLSTTAFSGTAPANGATGRTIKVGGAWKGPNAAENFPFNFVTSALTNAALAPPRINLKNDATYSITAAVTQSQALVRYQGYTTTFGDGGRFVLDGGVAGASYILLTLSASDAELLDGICQNNGATGNAVGVNISGSENLVSGLVVNSVRGTGLSSGGSNLLIECEAYACNQSNTAAFTGITCASTTSAIRCISHDNVGSNSSGFSISSGPSTLIGCIADTNGALGFSVSATTEVNLVGCDAYNNVSDGFRLSGNTAQFYLESCNAIKNGTGGTGWGINSTGTSQRGSVRSCAFGSGTQANTSGTTTGFIAIVEIGSVTYASGATPWVDPANGDFRINLAAAINAGRGVFTQTASGYAGTIGYPDIGAAQHLEGSVTPVFPSTPAVNLNAKTLSGFTALGTVTVGTTPITLESAFPGNSIMSKTAATVQFCTHEANSASGIIYIGDLTMLSATQAIASLLGPNVVFKLENMGALNTVPLGNIKLLANAAGQQVRISVLVS